MATSLVYCKHTLPVGDIHQSRMKKGFPRRSQVNQLLIRPATFDADAVYELLGALATSYMLVCSVFKANYPRVLDNDDTDPLVAEPDGHWVGYLLASDAANCFATGMLTEVLELYLVERNYRSEISRGLMQEALAHAQSRGSVQVTIPTGPTSSFYAGMGFHRSAKFFKLKLEPIPIPPSDL